MDKIKDIAGQRFGKLVAIAPVLPHEYGKHVKWVVLCDCGEYYQVSGDSLRAGLTKKCPMCKNPYGKSHPVYKTWNGIKGRTTNPNDPAWEHYGGRGIFLHPEWADNSEEFLRYVEGLPNYDKR